jgi:sulfite oxidase
LPVPDIDIKNYELEVEVEGTNTTKSFKFDELIKKYPKVEVIAAITCGGNRRSEMAHIKEIKGLFWSAGAIGNAVWTGIRLSDVLKDMGVKSDETSHVQFEGMDRDPTFTPYGASIPLSKAMDPRADVILAYEMNGRVLTRDHGFPLRVIVPGVVGARNVKWLGKITVSADESSSHWQQNDYKTFNPSTDWDNVDFSKSPAIQHMPVTSAICSPSPDDSHVKIIDNHVEVRGYAWSGGGNKIIRVDLTGDGGKTWQSAELEQMPDSENVGYGRHFGWTLFTARIPIKEGQQTIEVWSKATDSNNNTQPETFKNIWNLRGVCGNAYHRIRINLK